MSYLTFRLAVAIDLRRAGFTRAERLAFYDAWVKIGNDLTAEECAILVRFEEARFRRTGSPLDYVTLRASRSRLERLRGAA